MNRSRFLIPVIGVLLTLVISATSTSLGGFELRAERPDSDEAVLVVHTYGCDQPARAKITGTAEGLVAGKRHSVPLKLRATAKGVYAVAWEQPAEGTWVLAITGTYRGYVSSLLVNVDAKGQAVLPTPDARGRRIEPFRRNLTKADIAKALKQQKHQG